MTKIIVLLLWVMIKNRNYDTKLEIVVSICGSFWGSYEPA